MNQKELFLAYYGNELNLEELEEIVMKFCPKGLYVSFVKKKPNLLNIVESLEIQPNKKIFFCKTNSVKEHNFYSTDINDGLAVGSYDKNLMKEKTQRSNINAQDFTNMNNDSVASFMQFVKDIPFSVVEVKFHSTGYGECQVTAGISKSGGEYDVHLYYGYTKEYGEMVFSNNKKLLEEICVNVKEMADNTYFVDRTLYNIDGTEIIGNKEDCFNDLLVGVYNEGGLENVKYSDETLKQKLYAMFRKKTWNKRTFDICSLITETMATHQHFYIGPQVLRGGIVFPKDYRDIARLYCESFTGRWDDRRYYNYTITDKPKGSGYQEALDLIESHNLESAYVFPLFEIFPNLRYEHITKEFVCALSEEINKYLKRYPEALRRIEKHIFEPLEHEKDAHKMKLTKK